MKHVTRFALVTMISVATPLGAMACKNKTPMPHLCPTGSQMACVDHFWTRPPVCLDPQTDSMRKQVRFIGR